MDSQKQQKRLEFFKQKIKEKLESIRGDIPEIRYKLWIESIDACNDYNDLREMAELDMQLALFDYTRNEINPKIEKLNIELERLRQSNRISTYSNDMRGTEELVDDLDDSAVELAMSALLIQRDEEEQIEEQYVDEVTDNPDDIINNISDKDLLDEYMEDKNQQDLFGDFGGAENEDSLSISEENLDEEIEEMFSGETEELGDETEELDDETEELGDETEELDDETEELGDETEELGDETEELGDETEELDDETEELDDETEELDDELETMFIDDESDGDDEVDDETDEDLEAMFIDDESDDQEEIEDTTDDELEAMFADDQADDQEEDQEEIEDTTDDELEAMFADEFEGVLDDSYNEDDDIDDELEAMLDSNTDEESSEALDDDELEEGSSDDDIDDELEAMLTDDTDMDDTDGDIDESDDELEEMFADDFSDGDSIGMFESSISEDDSDADDIFNNISDESFGDLDDTDDESDESNIDEIEGLEGFVDDDFEGSNQIETTRKSKYISHNNDNKHIVSTGTRGIFDNGTERGRKTQRIFNILTSGIDKVSNGLGRTIDTGIKQFKKSGITDLPEETVD